MKAMVNRKYELPQFLEGHCRQDAYQRWLGRKAAAHRKRDRGRGNQEATREQYMKEIHRAVRDSGGRDHYTGELLVWKLISKYDNETSRASGRKYKKKFALLPTVDHVGDGLGPAAFRICSWRTNDAKNDLSEAEFVDLCNAVASHYSRSAG
jgi:hypothetical protein